MSILAWLVGTGSTASVVFVTSMLWLAMKRAAIAHDHCGLWDWADLAGGACGGVLMAPFLLAGMPESVQAVPHTLYRACAFAVALALAFVFLSLWLENERGEAPPSLEPAAKRFRE